MPTSVLLAVLAAAGLLALAPALVRRYDATERLVAERAQSTARVLTRRRRRRSVPGRYPVNPPRVLVVRLRSAAPGELPQPRHTPQAERRARRSARAGSAPTTDWRYGSARGGVITPWSPSHSRWDDPAGGTDAAGAHGGTGVVRPRHATGYAASQAAGRGAAGAYRTAGTRGAVGTYRTTGTRGAVGTYQTTGGESRTSSRVAATTRRRHPRRRYSAAIYRRRRLLAALLLFNAVELVGVLVAGPGFWVGEAVAATLLVTYLVHLRNTALAERRRRRQAARYAAWLAERQAEIRAAHERRAAARREAQRRLTAQREAVRRAIAGLDRTSPARSQPYSVRYGTRRANGPGDPRAGRDPYAAGF